MQRTDPDGLFSDGATMITFQGVASTGRGDAKTVEVGMSKGSRDFTGRTYLFLWNGTSGWTQTHDEVDVTITTSVS